MKRHLFKQLTGISLAALILTGCTSTQNAVTEDNASQTAATDSENTENITEGVAANPVVNENIIEYNGQEYIYATDTDGDDKYDNFDTDNDGLLDLKVSFNNSNNVDTNADTISDFSITSLSGQVYDNSTIAQNDLNVVIIWGYWCPDCVYELYHLTNYQDVETNTYYNYFDTLPDNVGVFGISVGSTFVNETNLDRFTEVTQKFCDLYDIPFDNVLGTSDVQNFMDSIRTYKTESNDFSSTVPAVALIDSDGNITWTVTITNDNKTRL